LRPYFSVASGWLKQWERVVEPAVVRAAPEADLGEAALPPAVEMVRLDQ
jgi:hypothetical protein